MAIDAALAEVNRTGNLPVPLHLRNAPTKLMKDLGYKEGYKYAHNYAGNYVAQQYLPEGVGVSRFWQAGANAAEAKMQALMDRLRGKGDEE